jgi:hypothetical protein
VDVRAVHGAPQPHVSPIREEVHRRVAPRSWCSCCRGGGRRWRGSGTAGCCQGKVARGRGGSKARVRCEAVTFGCRGRGGDFRAVGLWNGKRSRGAAGRRFRRLCAIGDVGHCTTRSHVGQLRGPRYGAAAGRSIDPANDAGNMLRRRRNPLLACEHSVEEMVFTVQPTASKRISYHESVDGRSSGTSSLALHAVTFAVWAPRQSEIASAGRRPAVRRRSSRCHVGPRTLEFSSHVEFFLYFSFDFTKINRRIQHLHK